MVQRALDLVTGIHHAFISDGAGQEDAKTTPETAHDLALEDAKRRRALHALLDLISFEGIYPCLSDGVGIPLEKRVISILPVGVIAKQASSTERPTSQNKHLLERILSILDEIIQDKRPSIQPIILGRILPDIISGIAELILAFNQHTLSATNPYNGMLDRILEK